MEKLIIRKRYTDNRCRIDSVAKGIIEDIAEKTNICEKEIASMMIKFANEHIEIKRD